MGRRTVLGFRPNLWGGESSPQRLSKVTSYGTHAPPVQSLRPITGHLTRADLVGKGPLYSQLKAEQCATERNLGDHPLHHFADSGPTTPMLRQLQDATVFDGR